MSATSTVTATAAANEPTAAEDNILRLVPGIDASTDVFQGHDAEQIRLMDEQCIVVDRNDVPIGKASKKICHLMSNIEKGLLHRAFSVFLFDGRNRLLLQQRASGKITFPDLWTNTCCSHPLAVAGEMGTSLVESVQGAKCAGQRKLEHELGIAKKQVPLDQFRFLTRIHYKAPSDGQWGEHEVDYILFIKADVDLDINPNEVQDVRYVTADELRILLEHPDQYFTPWFKLVCNSMLFEWWEHLDHGLENYLNEQTIRRM